MTITLNLAPEYEAQLFGIAARQGQDADQVAYSLFTTALAQAAGGSTETATDRAGSKLVWSAEFRSKYNIPADVEPLTDEEAGLLTPEEEVEAILLGLEDSLAGRVTPAAEWSAKFRARHNIPEGGQPMSHEDAKLLP